MFYSVPFAFAKYFMRYFNISDIVVAKRDLYVYR